MFRLIVVLFALLAPSYASAQVTQAQVGAAIASDLPTNGQGKIQAQDLRTVLNLMNMAIFQAFPGSSTVGDVACWNNTAGTLLADCGFAVPSGSVPAAFSSGQWTPNVVGETTAGTGQTYSQQYGTWEKMGHAATFTGSISGTTLNVTSVSSGVIYNGDFIGGAGIGTEYITSFGSGSGGVGTYNLALSTSISSETMTAKKYQVTARFNLTTIGIGTASGNADIAGLPFASAYQGFAGPPYDVGYGGCAVAFFSGFTFDTGFNLVGTLINPNASVVRVWETGSAAAGYYKNLSVSQMVNTQIVGYCQYASAS